MSFIQRAISLTFILADGNTFGSTGENTLTVAGLRVSCTIDNVVGRGMGQAHAKVYGLTLSQMTDISSVRPLTDGRLGPVINQLQITAGDDVNGMAQVFDGWVSMAQINMLSPPESYLELTALGGARAANTSPDPSSFSGSKDAIQMLQTLAGQINPPLTFENNANLSGLMLENHYARGSIYEQIYDIAYAVNINAVIDNGTLAVWPKGSARTSSPSINLSPSTGLIGYPTNWSLGVAAKCLFNPNLYTGCMVQLTSSLNFANGTFMAVSAAHQIESELPNGKWLSSFNGVQV